MATSGADWVTAVSTAVAAVGTVSTLGFLVCSYNRDLRARRREREREQASRIRLRARVEAVAGDGTVSLRLRVRNGSPDPIYNVMAFRSSAADAMIVKAAVVDGNDVFEAVGSTWGVSEGAMPPPVTVEFTDDHRRRWSLTWDHKLSRSHVPDDMLFSLTDDDPENPTHV